MLSAWLLPLAFAPKPGLFAPGVPPTSASSAADYLWTNATTLAVRGQHDWKAPIPNPFARFPSSAASHVRSAVYGLSRDAAGVEIAFTSNASSVALRWNMAESSCAGEGTVPIALCAGADLFVWDPLISGWRWAGSATNITLEAGITGHSTYFQMPMYTPVPSDPAFPAVERAYLLNLPMYGAVLDLAVGLPAGSSLAAGYPTVGPDEPKVKPLVWYGTSITQGAAASRPGMATTNIVSRSLNVEVLNMGFSGNGKLELNVTDYLVQIEASALILDCLHNMDAALVKNNTEPLVRAYRQLRPVTPIVFAEGVPYGSSWEGAANPSRKAQLERRGEFADAFERLEADGVLGLHYVRGDALFWHVPAGVAWQPTEGGTHPSDLGMASMATFWNRYLPSVVHGL